MIVMTVVNAWWSDPQSTKIGAALFLGLALIASTQYSALGSLLWRGMGRSFVIWTSLLMTVLCVLAFLLGLGLLLLTAQPSHVYGPFLLIGIGGMFIFGPMPLFAAIIHRLFEQRQLAASALRGTPTNSLMTSENTP